jgi:hypothetical protein
VVAPPESIKDHIILALMTSLDLYWPHVGFYEAR